MNCQECRDLFDDMLDRRIKEPLKRRMLNHLTNCTECSVRLERRRMAHAALFRALNHFDGIEHLSGGFADRLVAECRRPLPWWQNVTLSKWALVAASLVAMGGFVFAATVVAEAITAKDDDSEAMVGRVDPNAPQAAEGVDGGAASVVPAEASAIADVPSTDNQPPTTDNQLPSYNDQLENGKGERTMNLKQKAAIALAAATGIAASAMSMPDRFVTYIESNGSQYIDLGVTASGHVRAEATVAWTGSPSDETLIGAREGSVRYFLIHNNSSQITYGYVAHHYTPVHTEPDVVYDVVSDLQSDCQIVNVGGNPIENAANSSVINLSGNFYLFACNYGGVASWKTSARIYRLKIWKNNSLILDLRPCVSGGVAGLYDLKSGNFLTKAAGDALVAGPDYVEDKPEIFLSYLDSVGTQYVDTGIIGMDGVKGELDAAMLKVDDDATLMGDYGGSRFYLLHSYYGMLTYGYNADIPTSQSVPAGQIFKLEKDRRYTLSGELDAGLQRVCADGQVVFSSNSTSRVTWPRSIYLWACHGENKTMYHSTMRLYRAKIWQSGELVRDYVPCICKKQIGLFDQVEKRFVSSPIAFTVANCGQVTNIVKGTKPEHFLEYVANNGSYQRYVATGVRAESGIGMDTTMMWDEVPSDGSYLAARKGSDIRFYPYHYYQSHMIGYGGYSGYQTAVTATAGVKYRIHSFLDDGRQEIVVDRFSEGTWTRDASLSKTTAGVKDTELNLYLFGCNKDGAVSYASKSRCYSLRIYKNGTLVRDYLPVDYVGIPMLWDKVDKKLYPSAGTDQLIGGPVLGTFYLNGFTISIK